MISLGKSDKKVIGFDLSHLIDTRALIQANSGGGKSWLIRRLLEQSHGHVQQIVIDLEGEFSTLRAKYDYIIAGKGGDTSVAPKSAALLAHKLLELGVSGICDIYELKRHEQIRFVRLFLESLISAPKKLWHPVLVVIDEGHHFAPEKGKAESLSAVIDLVTRGRKRGLCAILATQRISKLHKDACADLLNKCIGRATLDIDQKRAADELGFTDKQQRLSLRDLEPGQFYAFGPALRAHDNPSKGVSLFKSGGVKTRHPRVGGRQLEAPPDPTKQIKKILSQLADLPEEARQEAHDIASLRTRVTQLKRELTIAQKDMRTKPDPRLEAKLDEMKTRNAQLESGLSQATREFKSLFQKLNKFTESVNLSMDHSAKIQEILSSLVNGRPKGVLLASVLMKEKQKNRRQTITIVDDPIAPSPLDDSIKISKPQQQILNVLLALRQFGLDSVERQTLAAHAGVSWRGGAFSNNLSALCTAGLVIYPQQGSVALTEAGSDRAVLEREIIDVNDLHEAWLSLKILSRPQVEILKVMLESYPETLSRIEIAERLEVSCGGGAFNNNVSRLKTMGAIEYPSQGYVKAAERLFINPNIS